MKKTRLLVFVFSVFYFSSCLAVHSGSMANSAALSSANFSYVKQNVSGVASATYFLGIGGLKKQSLVNDAKNNMTINSPLRENQALTNLTVNFKTTSYLGIVQTMTCFVTADIVEFKK